MAAKWLDLAVEEIGVREIPGAKSNPRILEYGKIAGIDWYVNDDTAWCAVFVNWLMVKCGYPSTKSALARSFVGYGERLGAPVPGAIVVFPRGSNPTYGHVAVVESVDRARGTIVCVNGNVSNQVKRSTYGISDILEDGIRWPPGAPKNASTPVDPEPAAPPIYLRSGDRGDAVRELQQDLNVLNYKLDETGEFDFATKDAVKRFQERRDLVVDGIVGPATAAALQTAVEDRLADQAIKKPATKTAAVGAGGASAAVAIVAEPVSQVIKAIEGQQDALTSGDIVRVVIGVVIVALTIWGVRKALQ